MKGRKKALLFGISIFALTFGGNALPARADVVSAPVSAQSSGIYCIGGDIAQAGEELAVEAAMITEAPIPAAEAAAAAETAVVLQAPPVLAQQSSGMGQQVVDFALQFVGNPYEYGGTSLTDGADCSGFVMSVYEHFGISLPHSSAQLAHVGTDVGRSLSNAQPGDLICYSGHVGIYIGNGQIVHASTESTGIKVSSASYKSIKAIRRVI